jgi:hypothetical protein
METLPLATGAFPNLGFGNLKVTEETCRMQATHPKDRQQVAHALREMRLASVELFQAILAMYQFVLEMRSSTQDAQTIPSPFLEGNPASQAASDSTQEPVEVQSRRMG